MRIHVESMETTILLPIAAKKTNLTTTLIAKLETLKELSQKPPSKKSELVNLHLNQSLAIATTALYLVKYSKQTF